LSSNLEIPYWKLEIIILTNFASLTSCFVKLNFKNDITKSIRCHRAMISSKLWNPDKSRIVAMIPSSLDFFNYIVSIAYLVNLHHGMAVVISVPDIMEQKRLVHDEARLAVKQISPGWATQSELTTEVTWPMGNMSSSAK
jgi:hypothetical protein